MKGFRHIFAACVTAGSLWVGGAARAEPTPAGGGGGGAAVVEPAVKPAVKPTGPGGLALPRGYETSRTEVGPRGMEKVGVDEKLGAGLPLDAAFLNEKGEAVTLGQYFRTGKPVVLQIGYFGCPKLCNLVAQSTVDALREIELDLGKDYTILYVSVDPTEKPALANKSKASYVQRYAINSSHDPDAAAAGWHFLTGPEISSKSVAAAVGFRYFFMEEAQQYMHPAVLMVLTPDGRVSRYLYGAKFDSKLMKQSIAFAGEGKSSSVMEQLILLCYHLDPTTGKHTFAAMRIMKLAGAMSVLVLGAGIGLMVMRGRHLRGIGADRPRRGLAAVVARGDGGGGGGDGGTGFRTHDPGDPTKT